MSTLYARPIGRKGLAAALALLGLSFLALTARADLLTFDSFDYPTGPLAGGNGGGGWINDPGEGIWSNSLTNQVTSPGLTWPGLSAHGNMVTTLANNDGSFRSLAANQGSVNGTNTLYISYLARLSPTNMVPLGLGSTTYGGISLFDGVTFGSVEKFFMGMPYEQTTWGMDGQLAFGAGIVTSNIPVNTTTHLFLYRFDFTADTVTVRMYIDPGFTEPMVPTATLPALPAFNFQQVRLQSGVPSNGAYLDFDELKIGTDYASVVPGTVSGTIKLDSYATNAVPITFEFRPKDGSATFTRTVTPAANGTYTVYDVPRKKFDVAIKGSKWLQKVVTGVNGATGNVTGVNATLLGGDATNDNLVDFDDLTVLAIAYNTAIGDPLYDDRADFTGDGQVEFADLTILAINYNLAGDP